MRKYIIAGLILFCFVNTHTKAQTNAIGIRFGGSDGVGAEISYQKFIAGPNRIEFDLGFLDAGWFDGFKGTVMYHWVHDLEDNFFWYVGAGGSLGAWNYDDGKPGNDNEHNEGLFLDANVQLGLEYYFTFPLQLSIDLRPEFGIINDDFDLGYGLGIRYYF